MKDTYINIGNFQTDDDPEGNMPFNESSGHSVQQFFSRVAMVADALGLEITDNFKDALIIKGTIDDLAYLQNDLGNKFSYAFLNEENLISMRNHEKEISLLKTDLTTISSTFIDLSARYVIATPRPIIIPANLKPTFH